LRQIYARIGSAIIERRSDSGGEQAPTETGGRSSPHQIIEELIYILFNTF
jgi:hypothetical protein